MQQDVVNRSLPGSHMNNAEKDPDDTFSDLLKIIIFMVIVIAGLVIWYLCS
ncbi:hypothetical protein ACQ86O_20525 [Serratia sp. L9]|uniref:hypothetical protein n=1 Tax=Serratia sp. L9 TaxID=3423946 RepID=UPI003D66E089